LGAVLTSGKQARTSQPTSTKITNEGGFEKRGMDAAIRCA